MTLDLFRSSGILTVEQRRRCLRKDLGFERVYKRVGAPLIIFPGLYHG